MKTFIQLALIIIFFSCSAGNKRSDTLEIQKFQKELNAEYQNPKETPLRGENFKNFTVHPFFPIDLKYRVTANFSKIENSPYFEFPTSSGKAKIYKAYGKATFNLDGESHTLIIYQSQDLIKQEEYKDHLFLPFHDLTNTDETYGGGKYIDLKIPNSNKIIVDFNLSYQPYCAYNAYDYSCPIVPKENSLPIKIEAGVKYLNTYFEH